MSDESGRERESSATERSLEWIRKFKTALGDLGRVETRATVLGNMISVSIEVNGVGHTAEYDPLSAEPVTSAEHFRLHLVQIRRRHSKQRP
jgi:hypothetical protein